VLVVAYWLASDNVDSLNKMLELFNDETREVGTYASRTNDRQALLSYFREYPQEFLFGAGPGNFRRYGISGITINWFGHNSYIHWLGELGVVGFLVFLAWLLNSCWAALKLATSTLLPYRDRLPGILALSLLISRCISAWGTEGLLGTDGMGYYSLYFVSVLAFFRRK
jgi:O-antigen ligase